ncbi:uncharacterized protein [Henckelia pumila]|uniref:uncharacterized protein n=1 Tax=Henckelia pumila TaxID=405737 RepID=UPI003C6E00D3
MAPKRKLKSDDGEAKTSAAAAAGTTKVTRSSTRRVNVSPAKAAASVPEPPPKKKKSKTAAPAVAEPKSETPPPTPPSPQSYSEFPDAPKTIIIEHCKQCSSFKTRALQVKKGLEEGVAGVSVLVNPDKPRRGCFEIREDRGVIFLSLLDLKRPFKPMKELNMNEVVSDIIDKIK